MGQQKGVNDPVVIQQQHLEDVPLFPRKRWGDVWLSLSKITPKALIYPVEAKCQIVVFLAKDVLERAK